MLKFKIGIFALLFALFPLTNLFAQQTVVKGKVVESTDQNPIPGVKVSIENSSFTVMTDGSGNFVMKGDLPAGEQVLTLAKDGYKIKRYPIVINLGKTLDLDILQLRVSFEDLGITEITLSDYQLDNERSSASNISGLLSASRDVFFSAAAYDFSAAFFSPRGLDNENGRVLINGIEMNKFYDGRPEYSDFGGLNDVKRNNIFYAGMTANPYQFGGTAGTSMSIMRASKYRKGGKIDYSFANRSYRGRVMASYSSGLMDNGWAYTFLASRRFGDRGFKEGTFYDANGFFASVEKKFNDKHSLNFTAFYSPKKRGKASSITEEVKELKGIDYNPNWGYLNGDIRNARTEEVKEPVFMLNHYWNITKNTKLNTNVAYQFGKRGSTRIDNGGTRMVIMANGQKAYIGGARNPSPDYYHNLPSYALQYDNLTAANFQKAYLLEHQFINDGQMDWNMLYQANRIVSDNGGNSVYIIQEDRTDDQQISANSILTTKFDQNITLNAALRYRHLHSENFAAVNDLLGGSGFLDISFYADQPRNLNSTVADAAQSDLNHPDRIVHEGDRYKYNYDINANYASAFTQAKFDFKRIDFFIGSSVSHTDYQRIGRYMNGYYPDNSYGKSPKLNFTDYGIKGGFNYSITGHHIIAFNGGYLTKAPVIRNLYPNARQNDFPVIGLESEKIQVANLSYILQSPNIQARVTGFYSGVKDATDIGFYFAQGLSGMGEDHDAAFVQEVTTGIDKRNLGFEYGVKVKITPTVSLKAAGSFRQSVYTNNPNLYLTSTDITENLLRGKQLAYAQAHEGTPLTFGDGTAKLKNYHVSSGPEQVFQFGFEYRDPHYWFVGATSNFFSHSYVTLSKIRRTSNFATAADGLPIIGYNKKRARELLKQDQLGSYMLINLMGGKSWKVGDYYFGFFAVVSNLLGQEYRSAGYESSRKVSFTNYNEDQSNPYGALFGNSYFYGYGTTFYLNFYLRF